jgi:hypothetical protein
MPVLVVGPKVGVVPVWPEAYFRRAPGDFGHGIAEAVDALFDVFHRDITEGQADVVRGPAVGEKLRALAHDDRLLVRREGDVP